MIDDLDVFEMMAPSTNEARKFVSRLLSRINSAGNDDESAPLAKGINGLIAFGRQPAEETLDFPSLGTTSNHATGINDYDHYGPRHIDGTPKLTEYLRYK